MSRYKLLIAALVGFLMAWTAPEALGSGITATYTTKTGSMTIHYDSPERARIDLSEPQTDISVLLVGSKTYIVDPTGQVVDMEEWWAQMQDFGPEADVETRKARPPQPEVTFESTGESETVAGIRGEIYRVHITEPDGSATTQELVLSPSEALLELWQNAVVAFFKRWMRVTPSGGEAWFMPLADQGLGLLRADGYELVEFERGPVDQALFEID